MNHYLMKLTLFFVLSMLSSCSEIPLNISFSSSALMWEETLPLGNGRLGAMPDGGIQKEKIVLNEETGLGVNGILIIQKPKNGF